MFFDEYYSLKHGPICSNALNGINGNLDKGIWAKNVKLKNSRDVELVRERLGLDEFSKSDINILRDVWQSFGWMNAPQIRKWTHQNCPEYVEVDVGRLPITPREILDALGIDDADNLAKQIEEYRHFEAMTSA